MNNLSRALAVTLMAATIPATIVLAQQATPADQPPAAEKSETQRGPSPETIARLQDGLGEGLEVLVLRIEGLDDQAQDVLG